MNARLGMRLPCVVMKDDRRGSWVKQRLSAIAGAEHCGRSELRPHLHLPLPQPMAASSRGQTEPARMAVVYASCHPSSVSTMYLQALEVHR